MLINNIYKYKNSEYPFYRIPAQNIDYIKFKKLFISLIWRASLSGNPAFQRVSLGPYNTISLDLLKNKQELTDDIFSIFILKDSPHMKYKSVVTFTSSKIAKKKSYKIHFSGYQFIIVPKSSDMQWNLDDSIGSPENYFFKKDHDLLILETEKDLSGKDNMLKKVYKVYSAHRKYSAD